MNIASPASFCRRTDAISGGLVRSNSTARPSAAGVKMR
jgi:hypothetical protein